MSNIDEQVRVSAKLLDSKNPTWFLKTRPDELSMTSAQRCILGQIYGSYSIGLAALGIHWSGIKNYGAAGFACVREETERGAELEVAWKTEINKRMFDGNTNS